MFTGIVRLFGEEAFVNGNEGYFWEWIPYIKKNGEPGKNGYLNSHRYFTYLNICDICGKMSTPKKINIRNNVWGWNKDNKHDYLTENLDMLCMSCWNKVIKIKHKEKMLQESLQVTKQLTTVIWHEQRNTNRNN